MMKVEEHVNLRDLLAEARAIHLAMRYGAITYGQAKTRAKPILRRINTVIELIAKEKEIKPQYIKFQDLGCNL